MFDSSIERVSASAHGCVCVTHLPTALPHLTLYLLQTLGPLLDALDEASTTIPTTATAATEGGDAHKDSVEGAVSAAAAAAPAGSDENRPSQPPIEGEDDTRSPPLALAIARLLSLGNPSSSSYLSRQLFAHAVLAIAGGTAHRPRVMAAVKGELLPVLAPLAHDGERWMEGGMKGQGRTAGAATTATRATATARALTRRDATVNSKTTPHQYTQVCPTSASPSPAAPPASRRTRRCWR